MTDPADSAQLVKVIYEDAQFHFDEAEATERCICTVVGWRMPSDLAGNIKIVSEQTPNGPRAITYVPVDVVHAEIPLIEHRRVSTETKTSA